MVRPASCGVVVVRPALCHVVVRPALCHVVVRPALCGVVVVDRHAVVEGNNQTETSSAALHVQCSQEPHHHTV